MRKVLVLGFVLVCVTVLSSMGVTPVERKVLSPDGTTALSAPTKPTQVEVTNFPAVQAVSGTVSVGNLSVDAEGRVLVATPPHPSVHFAGYTSATFQEGAGSLALNRACAAEFPNSRACEGRELVHLVPPPPVVEAQGMLVLSETASAAVTVPTSACLGASGIPFDCGSGPVPVACCVI